MSTAPDLPLLAALVVSLLVLVGAVFTLIGSIGLVRLRSYYSRTHAPTIGTSAGVATISLASIICFSVLGTRVALQEAFIFIFVTLTMPVGLIMLTRAALFRDRAEGSPEVPPLPPAPKHDGSDKA